MDDNRKKTLIVVDMQNDFIDGALGTKEAAAIVENVKKKIKEYADRGDEIIFTRDTHYEDYMETNEGKHLPVPHCIEETEGWEIAAGLEVPGAIYINKTSFGYTGWGDFDLQDVEMVPRIFPVPPCRMCSRDRNAILSTLMKQSPQRRNTAWPIPCMAAARCAPLPKRAV